MKWLFPRSSILFVAVAVVMAVAISDIRAGCVCQGADQSREASSDALPIVRSLGIGPSMAARVVGEVLYVIGGGRLMVADISEPARPRPVGEIDGLGNTRQIVVRDGVAYITSREDGVFLVDVRDPAKPKLLSRYDSVEVATGVDVCGPVLFVACRLHGLELVDVREPCRPRLAPATVVDLYRWFDPQHWPSDDADVRRISTKLSFGLPTVAFHTALLSRDRRLIDRVRPHVEDMVQVMLEQGRHYHRGENFNRTVVLGLRLLAARGQGEP
ncbi:MAG TPA: hypothetical protein EYP56_14035 [Planctomycetaceae bacterium]|nr:hypothetical protein [Planctomycetaceae bacterium]